MSILKVTLNTDGTGDVSIGLKGECSVKELEVLVGYLMAGLAANTSIEVLEDMVQQLKEHIDGRETSTSEDTQVS